MLHLNPLHLRKLSHASNHFPLTKFSRQNHTYFKIGLIATKNNRKNQHNYRGAYTTLLNIYDETFFAIFLQKVPS